MTAAASSQHPLADRSIRSYVRRQGRITVGQKTALQRHAKLWLLPQTHEAEAQNESIVLEPAKMFSGQAPLVLEIGFGMGEAFIDMVSKRLDAHFLGIEVYAAGVGAVLQQIQENAFRHVRLLMEDAKLAVQRLPPSVLAEVYVFFPDPWPKKRHHKRRLLQADFVAMLATRMQSGGRLFLATDWSDYALQMHQVCSAEPSLQQLHADAPHALCTEQLEALQAAIAAQDDAHAVTTQPDCAKMGFWGAIPGRSASKFQLRGTAQQRPPLFLVFEKK